MAFARIEPIGDDRADFRTGVIAAAITEPNRDRKKKKEPFRPTDFMYFMDKPEEQPPTVEESTRKLKELFGGKGIKHGRSR